MLGGEKGGGGGETKWVTYGFSLPSYLRVWQLLFRKIFRKILVLIDKFIFSFFTRDFMTLYCNDRIKIKKTLPYLTLQKTHRSHYQGYDKLKTRI